MYSKTIRMNIKDAIKQSSFLNEFQKAMINLLFTQGWLKDRIGAQLKPYGITMQQYNVLRILNGQYPRGITTSDIRDRMIDKMSDASRLVDRLERMQLVEKKKNIDDRRLVAVTLTPKGVDLVERIRESESKNHSFIKNLTEEEAKTLNILLDKIRKE